jgi:protease I
VRLKEVDMKDTALDGIRVAILATDGFEQSELMEPKEALEHAGAEVEVISLEPGEIVGWKDKDWGDSVPVDATVDEVESEDFDALMLPGGVINPDLLRLNERAVEFTQGFVDDGKPIAAICHGPQLLIETNAVDGRTLTSWPSLRTDLENAGAVWVNEEVVTDNGLITSRKPADIPAFNEHMIEEFSRGVRESDRDPDESSRSFDEAI